MSKVGRLGLIGGLALVAAVVLAAAGHGSSLAKRQGVVIQITAKDTDPGLGTGTFKLIAGPGTLDADRGTVSYAEGIYRQGIEAGQSFELGRGTDMLTGKAGTLVIRRNDRLVSAGPYQVVTGPWTVVGGTGVYAGVRGGGRHAAVGRPSGSTYVQYEGVLTTP